MTLTEKTPAQKTLTQDKIKKLKAEAHHIEPTVIYGKNGITETFVAEVTRNLEAHELIKVKFIKSKEDKKAISTEISVKTASEIVSFIGNILLLYKEQKDKK